MVYNTKFVCLAVKWIASIVFFPVVWPKPKLSFCYWPLTNKCKMRKVAQGCEDLQQNNLCKRGSANTPLAKGSSDQQSNSLPVQTQGQSSFLAKGEKAVATLDPPPLYFQSFHQAWLHQIGQAKFRIGRNSLLQKRNTDNFHYFCLWLLPIDHKFPVIQPHLSLGKFRFEGYLENWRGVLQCQAYLWERVVEAQFTNYGTGMGFKLLGGNELFALQQLLKEILTQESVEQKDLDRDPHISWAPL